MVQGGKGTLKGGALRTDVRDGAATGGSMLRMEAQYIYTCAYKITCTVSPSRKTTVLVFFGIDSRLSSSLDEPLSVRLSHE